MYSSPSTGTRTSPSTVRSSNTSSTTDKVMANVNVLSDEKEDEMAFASVPLIHSNHRNQRTKISYAILLFDHDNNVLVIRRPTSYAFSSFFNYLCTLDQYNYEALLNEFTLEERDLLRQYWRSDGLEPLIKIYLDRAFPSAVNPILSAVSSTTSAVSSTPSVSSSSAVNPNTAGISSALAKEEERIRTLLVRKFKVNRTRMQTRWNSLIQINNLNNLPSRTCPRMYGFPKVHGPDNKKWTLSREQFIHEVGCPPPGDTQFKKWMPVTYCSNDGFQYSFELMVGSCQHFELPSHSRASWINLSSVSSFDEADDSLKDDEVIESNEPKDVSVKDDEMKEQSTKEKAYFVPEVVEAFKRMHSIALGHNNA
jgi:hypothetical protein